MFKKFKLKLKIAMNLLKACWKVLMLDKELLVFPLLSIIVLGLLAVSFVWPLYESGALMSFLENMGTQEEGAGNNQHWMGGDKNVENYSEYYMMAITFVAYFVTFFVMIFFNAALIACVKIRFAGGDPVVMDGLRASMVRLPQIAAWAFVAALVGFILDQLKNKEGEPPNFIIGMLGAGWAIAVYFAVPVLVSERVSPIQAVKRSVAIIKKTWGEALIAEVGLGVLYGLATLGGFLFFMAGMIFFNEVSESPVIALSIWTVGVIYALVCGLVFSTLGSILKSALYVYAVNGKIPYYFDDDLIKNAFVHKEK